MKTNFKKISLWASNKKPKKPQNLITLRLVADIYAGEECLKLVEFTTSAGEVVQRQIKAEAFDSPTELRRKLAGYGANLRGFAEQEGLASPKDAVQALQDQQAEKSLLGVKSFGWQTKGICYVAPTRSIGHDRDHYWSALSSITPEGTLEGWQEAVQKAMRYSPPMTLVVGAALSAVLLRFVDSDNRIIMLTGPSSIGKTSLLRVAISPFSSPAKDLLKSWHGTEPALSEYLARQHDLPTAMDEIAALGNTPDEIAKKLLAIVYLFANSSGKSRHSKSGYAEEVKRTVILSSYELSVPPERMGQAVRLLNVPVFMGQEGLGIFTKLPKGYNSGAEFQDACMSAISANYGHAGPAFVKYVARKLHKMGESHFTALVRKYVAAVHGRWGTNKDGLERRMADSFALAEVALKMAIKADILPGVDPAMVEKHLNRTYRTMRKAVDEDRRKVEQVLAQFAAYLETKKKVCRKTMCDKRDFRDVKVLYQDKAEGRYFIRKATLDAWLAKHSTVPVHQVKEKIEEYFIPEKKRKSKTVTCRLAPWDGQSCYRISGQFLKNYGQKPTKTKG
ncbi:MAG TPA: DUF927 domain-containing protein [Alphaproteobacteria bacterium]|nr:DUF927 domain-containing protein [Alphaproteobacteria bacterium]